MEKLNLIFKNDILIIYDTKITTFIDENISEVHFETNYKRNANIIETQYEMCFPNVQKVIFHFKPTLNELENILKSFYNVTYILFIDGYCENNCVLLEECIINNCSKINEIDIFNMFDKNFGKILSNKNIKVNLCLTI